MKILLNLSKVCIETASKKAYNQSLSQYFKAQETEKMELEAAIDMLVRFLNESDFQELRNTYQDLRGGSEAVIELRRSTTGEINLHINNSPI